MNDNTEPKDVKDVKPKRGRPKGVVDTYQRTRSVGIKLDTEPGDISKITAFNTQWLSMPTIDTGNRQAIEERIVEYFNACIANDMRPGVAGLCAALGICRTTWYYWGTGERQDYQDIVERTRSVMESITEQYMLQGKINPVTGIFLLKNHFGYTDKNEVVLTPNNNPLGEPMTEERMEALKQKYLDNTYGIAPESIEGTDTIPELPMSTDKSEQSTRMKDLEKKYLGGYDNE